MSEREKAIIETIAEALPNMSEFDKGYFLGVAESSRQRKDQERKEAEPLAAGTKEPGMAG